MKAAAILSACYLIGAIPFGLLVGKALRGIDIRKFGSGNIGASNILRTLGVGPAIVVFALDTAKGTAAVALTTIALRYTVPENVLQYYVVAGAIMVILGHNFSVFLKFQGGKGVATSLGVIIGFAPIVAGVTFIIWVSIVAAFRYISVASIVAALSTPVMMQYSKELFGHEIPVSYRVCALVAALFILFKHKSNILRLRQGKEPRIGEKISVEEDTIAE